MRCQWNGEVSSFPSGSSSCRRIVHSPCVLLFPLLILNITGCTTPLVKPTWPDKKFDCVVGYLFVNPPGEGSPFLDGKNGLDLTHLGELKRRGIELDAAYTEELFKAIDSNESPSNSFLCYDPHHIFVFYSRQRAIAAFEVCFLCSATRSWPAQPSRAVPSYRKLSDLCNRIGLGVNPPDDQHAVFVDYYKRFYRDRSEVRK